MVKTTLSEGQLALLKEMLAEFICQWEANQGMSEYILSEYDGFPYGIGDLRSFQRRGWIKKLSHDLRTIYWNTQALTALVEQISN